MFGKDVGGCANQGLRGKPGPWSVIMTVVDGPKVNNALLTLRSIRAPAIDMLERILNANIPVRAGRLLDAAVNATRFATLTTNENRKGKVRKISNLNMAHKRSQSRK